MSFEIANRNARHESAASDPERPVGRNAGAHATSDSGKAGGEAFEIIDLGESGGGTFWRRRTVRLLKRRRGPRRR